MNAVDKSTSENVVEIYGLSRKFDSKLALSEINLTIPRGKVFGLIGGNGAGKTTLLKHILGLHYAQSGSVRVFGFDPVANPVEVLSKVGYMSENRDLPNWMKVADLIRYTQAFYPNWDSNYAEELCSMFDLDRKSRVYTLSRGQRARACLLVALAHRPELLVLDEPSSGLDPVVRRDILGAIIRTIADEGRTVLFSSHLLDEVERVADTIAVVHEGKIQLTGSMDSIKDNYRRITVRFQSPQQSAPHLLGSITHSGQDYEWTYICNGDRDKWLLTAAECGASVVEDVSLTLDDIFLASINKN